jgi:nucleoid-associated protein YgaU
MGLQQSYQDVLDVAKTAGVDLSSVAEEGGKLVLTGTCQYASSRDILWNQIKTHPSWQTELMVMLTVTDTSIYGLYKVVAGDTLGKIAKRFYGDPKHYTAIFEANTDQLKSADLIKVGQTLKLPNQPAQA